MSHTKFLWIDREKAGCWIYILPTSVSKVKIEEWWYTTVTQWFIHCLHFTSLLLCRYLWPFLFFYLAVLSVFFNFLHCHLGFQAPSLNTHQVSIKLFIKDVYPVLTEFKILHFEMIKVGPRQWQSYIFRVRPWSW